MGELKIAVESIRRSRLLSFKLPESTTKSQLADKKFVSGSSSATSAVCLYVRGRPFELSGVYTSIHIIDGTCFREMLMAVRKEVLWSDSWAYFSPRIRRFSCKLRPCSSTNFSRSDCCMGKQDNKDITLVLPVKLLTNSLRTFAYKDICTQCPCRV